MSENALSKKLLIGPDNRDVGWNAVTEAGWIGVSIASIDNTWSAFRFRPLELSGRKVSSQ